MAMTTCGECGRAVSTTAAACPNCGAPPTAFVALAPAPAPIVAGPPAKKSSRILWIIGGGAVLIWLIALATNSPPKHNAVASAASTELTSVLAPPPPPPHQYSVLQDGEYGYEQALSDDDTKAGRAVKPLLMIRYLGKRSEIESWAIVDGGATAMFSCKVPCEIVRQENYGGGVLVGSQTLRVTPGSILGAVVEDIQNAQLLPYDQARKAATAEQQATSLAAADDPRAWNEADMSARFRCPESYATEEEGKTALGQMVAWYGSHHSPVTVQGLMTFRMTLLTQHGCTQTLANIAANQQVPSEAGAREASSASN